MDGLIFATKQKTSLSDCATRITHCLNDTVANFVKVGYYLAYIDMNFKFNKEADGYANFDEFCVGTYNLSRRSVRRFIDIFREFGRKDDQGRYLCGIADEYKGFSCAQLAEMLSLSEEKRILVDKDTPSTKIREMKRKEKNGTGEDSDDGDSGELAQAEDFTLMFSLGEKGGLLLNSRAATDLEEVIADFLSKGYAVGLHFTR